MDDMNITTAQHITAFEGNNIGVKATVDGQEMFVPIDEDNRHYAEILKQVEDGKLTIQDADPVVQADDPASGPSIDELTSRIAALDAKVAKLVRK